MTRYIDVLPIYIIAIYVFDLEHCIFKFLNTHILFYMYIYMYDMCIYVHMYVCVFMGEERDYKGYGRTNFCL